MTSSDGPVAVIGLGYVGLPLAVEFGKNRSVIGFDIKADRIAELRAGHDHTREVPPEGLAEARHLSLTSNPADLSDAKIFIVTVPTHIDARTRQMKRLPDMIRRSMTYYRGNEMACQSQLAQRLKIDIRFCDPHAPWQRGSNENTNGLLRQLIPKGTA